MRGEDVPNENWLTFDRWAVYGLGRSGRAAARLLADHGKRVVASDTKSRDEFEEGTLENLPDTVELAFGCNDSADADAVVVSPGLSPQLEAFERLDDQGIPYCSEIDLAFDAAEAEVAAVTGTDGKTTTTTILGEIAAASERESVVGGNIGEPLSAVVGDVSADGLIVAEVSAFQLWSAHHFAPRVGAVTNVAGDHLDYFTRRSDYEAAKRRLLELVAPGGVRILNADDSTVWSWRPDLAGRRGGFGLSRPSTDVVGDGPAELESFVYASDGVMHEETEGGSTTRLAALDTFDLPGSHNVANALCAAAMARAMGLGTRAIRGGIDAVEPLSHRLEPVERIDGVDFVDDSKATNVNAAVTGLAEIPEGYVAIVGGVDKGLDLDEFVDELRNRAGAVVTIGELAGRIRRELVDADRGTEPPVPVDEAEEMNEAVERAFERAREFGASGATVVLSPAASSFDMFESYEDRGETYQEAVRRLGP